MNDPYLESVLERQHREGMELARNSDILELLPVGEKPYRRYIARFHCKGLVKTDRSVTEWDCFDVGILFTDDHLRRVEPERVATLLWPPTCFHPNVAWPFLCVGEMLPGTKLTTILFQVYDILSFMKFTPEEHKALNRDACMWTRQHMNRFPLDKRPLRRPRSANRAEKNTSKAKEKQ